jgi:hypothetical protein
MNTQYNIAKLTGMSQHLLAVAGLATAVWYHQSQRKLASFAQTYDMWLQTPMIRATGVALQNQVVKEYFCNDDPVMHAYLAQPERWLAFTDRENANLPIIDDAWMWRSGMEQLPWWVHGREDAMRAASNKLRHSLGLLHDECVSDPLEQLERRVFNKLTSHRVLREHINNQANGCSDAHKPELVLVKDVALTDTRHAHIVRASDGGHLLIDAWWLYS